MRARRGIVLILTLIIVVMIGVISTQLFWMTYVDASLSRNQLAETQNFALALGGVEIAKSYLATDQASGETWDSFRDVWADPEETGQPIGAEGDPQVDIVISSEEGKLNLNGLLREDLRELFEDLVKKVVVSIGYDEQVGESIIANVDAAAGDAGQPLATIYDMVGEDVTIAMVEGDSVALLEESTQPTGQVVPLQDVFTVLSTGDLNVNLLQKNVFQAICQVLPDSVKAGTESAELADNYVDYRGEPGGDGEDMKELAHLANVSGFDGDKLRHYLEGQDGDDAAARLRTLLTVQSSTFKVEIETCVDDVPKYADAFLRRDFESGEFQLLFWKEMDSRPRSR